MTRSVSPRGNRFRFGLRRLAFFLFVTAALISVALPLATDASADFVPHTEVVSNDPVEFTPAVLDGKVLAIAPVGPDLVVVGGDFTQVQDASGVTMTLPNIFAFRRSTGLVETSFDPVLNNDVTSLVAGPDGASVFVGGFFTTVNGETNKKGLTKLDLNGDRVTEFKGRTDRRVKDLALVNGVLYVAGTFSKITGTPVEVLAALDPVTGALLPDINFDFGDEWSTTLSVGTLSVDKIDLNSDGSTMAVIGNFGTIDGQSRARVAVFDLSTGIATIDPWQTMIYENQCGQLKPQYISDIDIAPDGSYMVIASSGGYGGGDLSCDTASRFELDAAGSDIQPTWSNYSGGDTYLGIAISGEAIYVGGHFRWLNNPFAAGQFGPGGVPRRGFAALDPLNGLPLSFRADRAPRGIGTYEVLADDGGIWIGDDTENLNFEYHPRLKYLPLGGGAPVARPAEATLPTTIFDVGGNSLMATGFDGGTFDPATTVATAFWDEARGMMFLGGALWYGWSDGDMYARVFDGTTLGERSKLDRLGLTDANFPLGSIGGMYFDHDLGRIYYTVQGDPTWYYRYFTPESAVIGAVTFEAPASTVVPWASVRGMDRIDDHLYYGLPDGNLYRVDMIGNEPVAGTTITMSGPAIDGRDWSDTAFAFYSDGQLFNPEPARAEFDFSSTGSTTSGSWQVFTFPATPGEIIDVKVQWDDPAAELNVFLRDPVGNTIEADGSANASPKWLATEAAFGGNWSVAVKIKEGSTDFDVLVNPFEPAPAIAAEHVFMSNGCDNLDSFQTFKFPVVAGDQVDVSVAWDDPTAALNIFLRDETKTMIVGDATSNGSPKPLATVATSSGDWTVAVKVKSGCTDFDVLVDADGANQPADPPPVPVARWSLNGDFVDDIGTNDGTGVNAPVFENLGGDCHYALFDGSLNQWAEVPYAAELNPNEFTVSLWARLDGGSGFRSMVASRWETELRDDRYGYALFANGLDRWVWRTGEGATDHQQPGPNVAAGEWTHLAVTFEQTGVDPATGILIGKKKFFVNGSLADQRNGFYQPNTSGMLTIGANSTKGLVGNTNRFTGGVDEVHVFDRVLTGTEINQVIADKPSCSAP